MNFFFSKKTNYKLHFVSRLTAAAAAAAAVATEREERLRRLRYAHNAYPQCVFWTIPTGSRCVHCVTIHESVTRTIYECRSICCSQNNNVSLCWVDSNYTLYTMMCSFWHRYTFTLIPSSRVVDTNVPFVVRLVRPTTTTPSTHFYFIFMCIYCSIVRAVRLVLIQFNMLCVNTVVFQIMRHAGGVRSFRFPFCYIVPFFHDTFSRRLTGP